MKIFNKRNRKGELVIYRNWFKIQIIVFPLLSFFVLILFGQHITSLKATWNQTLGAKSPSSRIFTSFCLIKGGCSGENECSVNVSSAVFGDPCPGTFKYIEVHYTCGIATTTTTTARSRPSWFIETREPVWILPTVNSSVTPAVIPLPHTSSPPPPLHHAKVTTTKAVSTTVPTTTTTTTVSTTTSTTMKSSTTSTTVASKTTTKSIPSLIDMSENDVSSVNKSSLDTHAVAPEVFVQHPTQLPDTTPKTSTQTHVKAVPVTPPSVIGMPYDDVPWCPPSFARGLYWNWTKSGETAVLVCPGGATGTAKRKCLVGGWKDPADLSACRSAWLMSLKKRANTPDEEDSVTAVANELAKVTANNALYGGDLIIAPRIIKTLSRRMMQDVVTAFPEPHQRQALATEFLQSALGTGSALLSAGLVGPWGDLSQTERRFAVTELMLGLEEAAFLLSDVLPRATQAVHFRSHVLASARAVAADGSPVQFPSTEDEMVDWVFMDRITIPPEAVLENSEGSSTRVIFLTYRHLEDLLSPEGMNFKGSKNRNVSRIVNSRVVSASLGHGRHIQLPEPVTLTFALLKHDNVSNPICAFWDYTTSSWSDEGCFVHSFTRTHVTCKCDHLTNFAVIMDESSGIQEEENVSPLRILAYVGCLVCVLCVAGSLLIFTLFRNISSPRTYIQRHVCVCLLGAELAFLIGVWRTDLPILCGITAGFLHYCVLAAFAWMFLEGVHVYFTVTRPIESEGVHLRWWHYIVAYIGPLLVVSIAAIVDPFSFGTPSWLRSAVLLLLLMVLTWSLALLLLHQPSLPVAVAFCVFNALHGIFIFVYYCVRNEKVRNWCGSSSEQERNTWIPQLFRNVFVTEKQTYSPNNNNTTTSSTSIPSDSSSQPPPHSHHHHHHHPHHQVISQALNHALTAAPSIQQVGSSLPLSHNPSPLPQPPDSLTATTTTSLSSSPSSSSASSASSSSSSSSSLSSYPPQHTPIPPPTPPPPSSHHHHHHHHIVLDNGAAYLPTLCHVDTLKGPASLTPTVPQFPGTTCIMGSRGSLRQTGSVGGYPLPMGSLHQSLPRNRLPHSTTTITTTTATTVTPLPSATLNPPSADEEVSYKSFSRDSGHGGSEQEDSPRTPWIGHRHSHTHTISGDHKGTYLARMNALNQHKGESEPFVCSTYALTASPTSVTPSIAAMLRTGAHRANSPWNHTYMEIEAEGDPVYEEIERERWGSRTVGGGVGGGAGSEVMQVSDLSDEDIKRGPPSDVSRQSSRSYGDSRPLLPYIQPSQAQGRVQLDSQYALSEERLRDFNAAQMSRDLEHLQKVQQHLSRENLMTVAVLNGEQVVCRLSSPSHSGAPTPQSPQNLPIIHESNRNPVSSSSFSPTSNGYPPHVFTSRQQSPLIRQNEC
ncbi:Latrophilin Cirl [Armadillidium vulgare]|nr:Latrophilin Cirl [Armadillidium vulgare]